MGTGIVRPKVKEKNLKQARMLAAKNGGKLPNPWKMIQQGHSGLHRYKLRHPNLFVEFQVEEAVGKEKRGNKMVTFNIAIREEHLKTARGLKKQLGFMPDEKWLLANGYTRLAAYQRVHSKAFAELYSKNGKVV